MSHSIQAQYARYAHYYERSEHSRFFLKRTKNLTNWKDQPLNLAWKILYKEASWLNQEGGKKKIHQLFREIEAADDDKGGAMCVVHKSNLVSCCVTILLFFDAFKSR